MSRPLRALAVLLTVAVFAGCSGTAATSSSSAPTASTPAADTTQTAASTDSTARTEELRAAVRHAERLQRELQAFESHRKATKSAVEAASSTALERLSDDPTASEVRLATSAWRADWMTVQSEMQKLEREFSDVEAAAVRYFNHLERQTSSIADGELRADERERNGRIEHNWTNATVKATAHMEDLRVRVHSGDDLYVAMLNASLRSGFDENLDRLKTLTGESESMLAELQQFTRSGRSLLIDEATDEAQPAAAPAVSSTEAPSSSQGR